MMINIKYAILFSGQGTQKVGMLANLAIKYPIVKKTFLDASTVLGYDLWDLVQKGPTEKLNNTIYAQPALLSTSVAIWRILQQEYDKPPLIMAGHSLGEYSAIVCAGGLDFYDAMQLVAQRAHFMQEAVPVGYGAMSAIIGLNKVTIQEVCNVAAQNQIVSLANINNFEQIVISGHTEAVKRATYICKGLGAKYVLPLLISIPSHCALMKPAAIKLEKLIKKIQFYRLNIPIITNVDVDLTIKQTTVISALIRQLYNTVLWEDIINVLLNKEIKFFVEISPKSVLIKLINKNIKNIYKITINDNKSLTKALNIFRNVY